MSLSGRTAAMRSTDFVRRETNPKRGFNIDPSTLSCANMQRQNTYCEENTGTGRNKKCSNYLAELENKIGTFLPFAAPARFPLASSDLWSYGGKTVVRCEEYARLLVKGKQPSSLPI